VLSSRELDHWESGEDFLRESDRHASFVRYQDSLLREFGNLADQYGFETVDARRSVREVFETLQQRVMTTLETMDR
jgi:dTMP kinase